MRVELVPMPSVGSVARLQCRDRSGILGADEHLLQEKSMAMKIDRIQPAGMNVRMQQGKPAYSHVVTVTGPGKTIYIAGQLARDAEGNIVGPGDMRAQLEQTFKNLDACLKAAGATWADVVKTNTSSRTTKRSRSAPTCACATSG